MGEYTLILVGLIAICLLASLVHVRKNSPTTQLYDARPADYAVTIWAEQGAESAHAEFDEKLVPHRITAEYLMRLQVDSAADLDEALREFVRRASADFRQRFTPVLGEFNIGAVLCQPAQERE